MTTTPCQGIVPADLAAKTTPPVPLHVIHDQIEKTRDVAEEDTHA